MIILRQHQILKVTPQCCCQMLTELLLPPVPLKNCGGTSVFTSAFYHHAGDRRPC